ncbi:MAG TPA: hypothetical protein VG796_20510 [Verrucomicrobiales bacterium]|nr:hypothetical protein [Verrucomicrobiales bacterium]
MNRSPVALLLTLFVGVTTVRAVDPALDVDASAPVASASNPGFIVRTVQAPDGTLLENNFLRAVRQLNGTLLDNTGDNVPNVALPGPNPDGTYDVTAVDFTTEPGAGLQGYFPGDQQFPGTDAAGQRNLFSTEVITFLSLPQGTVRMGVVAAFTRTDELDDDGWRLYSAANPRSYFGVLAGEYARTAPPFPDTTQELAGNTTEFNITVPQAGVYPFRLVYWQQDRRSMLEWYVVKNPGTPEEVKYLIGSPESGIAAYKAVSLPVTTAPYVGQVSPLPESAGVSSSQPIEAVLFDGANAIDLATLKMTLNGAAVTPQSMVRSGKKVTVTYTPNASRTTLLNVVGLEFKDTTGFTVTNQWKFTISVAGAAAAPVTGQWDFDEGDLRATTGAPLRYFDPAAAAGTTFGTTRDFAIADINGQPALVMRVPGDLDRRIGYVMEHGIAPNGGGTRVNQYTLVMDVYVETTGPGAASLFQISSLSNTDDGDLFWQGNQFGQGTDGYRGTGAFTAGAWHRICAAYDMAATPPVVTKYVDGIKQDDWTNGQSLDNPRRALQSTAILFADGDVPNVDERRVMYVNSVQIRAGKLSDAQMVLLGGPDACGIPAELPVPQVAGQWDFERADLSATVGKPLAFLDGAGGVAQTGTTFGTAADFGITDIPGSTEAAPGRFMRVPGELDRNIGYVMTHGISPNGGGTLVNQYTLIMDIYVDTAGPGAASLLQISSLNNMDDGDLFWQGNNFGQGTDGYRGTGAFTAGAWHRIVAAYDMAATPPVVTKYVDGIKQDDWTNGQSLDNPRRSLQPTAILFADGDVPNVDERRVMYVNSVQIRPGKLTDAQMVLLGGPHAWGIPVNISTSNVTGQWDFDSGNLAATVGKPLAYFDGAGGVSETGTVYGDTTSLGVAQIDGADAKIMVVPGALDRNIGYVMTHGIAPNGGGTKVNQYTIIFDVMIDGSGPGAASMLQISSLTNMDDGDLFWQGNNFGQGTDGYRGQSTFTASSWHRVCASYDMAATPPVVTKVVDGIFQDFWTNGQGLDNARRALQPTAILFADGDVPNVDERRQWWVNSVQIRSGALTVDEMAALGGPQAGGIPITVPVEPLPKLCFGRSAGKIVLVWPLSTDSGWVLQSTSNLNNWGPVQGVTNNSYIADPATLGPKTWFRLAKNPPAGA